MAATVTAISTTTCGADVRCRGTITWGGADTYLTGGIGENADANVRARLLMGQFRLAFGINTVRAIAFMGGISDAQIATGEAAARYVPTNGAIKLFLLGRTTGSPGVAQPSETEVANATSVNAGRLEFVAICRGGGASSPSGRYT